MSWAAELDGRPTSQWTGRRRTRKRLVVLVVDDHAEMRELLARRLEHLGHRAVAASSVAEAIATLSSVEVDLVLSDLNMPGGTGLDLLSYVRHRSRLPFVLTSAEFPPGIEDYARAAGADVVVAKAALTGGLTGVLEAAAA